MARATLASGIDLDFDSFAAPCDPGHGSDAAAATRQHGAAQVAS